MKTKIFILVFCGLLSSFASYTQTPNATPPADFNERKTLFQHLQQYDKILIKTKFDSLMVSRSRAGKQEAVLIAVGDNTLKMSLSVEPRGVFRRRTCDVPPLKLDFSKPELDSLGLHPNYDHLKLVTHCMLNTENRLSILKEYWTYKMYQEVTPNSFLVHLFEITYQDINNKENKIKNLAFLIENTEEMAHRINGTIIRGMGKTPADITPASYQETLLFQYMIGNTDWDVLLERNVKFVQKPNENKLTLVPYDFDFTGFTKPPYWKLVPVAGKKLNVDNRIPMGVFNSEVALLETASRFLALKKTGFQCYKTCPILTASDKKIMGDYLQSFFRLLKKESSLTKLFLEEK